MQAAGRAAFRDQSFRRETWRLTACSFASLRVERPPKSSNKSSAMICAGRLRVRLRRRRAAGNKPCTKTCRRKIPAASVCPCASACKVRSSPRRPLRAADATAPYARRLALPNRGLRRESVRGRARWQCPLRHWSIRRCYKPQSPQVYRCRHNRADRVRQLESPLPPTDQSDAATDTNTAANRGAR